MRPRYDAEACRASLSASVASQLLLSRAQAATRGHAQCFCDVRGICVGTLLSF